MRGSLEATRRGLHSDGHGCRREGGERGSSSVAHMEEGGKDGAARWKSLPSPSSSCDMEVGGREEGRKGEGTSELDLTVPPSW